MPRCMLETILDRFGIVPTLVYVYLTAEKHRYRRRYEDGGDWRASASAFPRYRSGRTNNSWPGCVPLSTAEVSIFFFTWSKNFSFKDPAPALTDIYIKPRTAGSKRLHRSSPRDSLSFR